MTNIREIFSTNDINFVEPFLYNEIVEFYHLNIDNIIGSNKKRATINTEKYKQKQTECLSNDNIITQSIFNILDVLNPKIITVTQFYKTMTSCYIKLIDKMVEILNDKKNTKFYLYLGENLSKSNFWLCNLFIHIIEQTEHKNKLSNKIFFYDELMVRDIKNNKINILKININENNIFVFLDDCSYSGRQLKGTLIDKRLELFNKTKSEIICVVPYISQYASEYLIDDNITFVFGEILPTIGMNKTTVRKLLTSNLIIINDAQKYHDILYDTFGILYLALMPYLFEHKIADNYSIPQYMYNFINTYSPDGYNLLIKLNETYVDDLVDKNFEDGKISYEDVESLMLYKKNVLEDIENYSYDKPLKYTQITPENFENVNSSCNKNIGILDNCQESYYDNFRNYSKKIDYEKDEICYRPIYSFKSKITNKLKNIFLSKIIENDNLNIINNYEIVDK